MRQRRETVPRFAGGARLTRPARAVAQQEQLVSQVKEEANEHYRALLAQLSSIHGAQGGADAASPEAAANVMVHNRALLRNKRLLLAYVCVHPRVSACVETEVHWQIIRRASLAATPAWPASRRCAGRWAAVCLLRSARRCQPASRTFSKPIAGAQHSRAFSSCSRQLTRWRQAAGQLHGSNWRKPELDVGAHAGHVARLFAFARRSRCGLPSPALPRTPHRPSSRRLRFASWLTLAPFGRATAKCCSRPAPRTCCGATRRSRSSQKAS